MGEIISSSGMNNDMCMLDSIDRLPNELLTSIVSCLPVKEAARTSILSQRWRQLWRFRSVFDFDGPLIISDLNKIPYEFRNRVKTRFANLVTRVLDQLHSCTTIEKFRILFELYSFSSNHIDRWLEFALTKRVKTLELDLGGAYKFAPSDSYKFPNICDPVTLSRIFPMGLNCDSLVIFRLSHVDIAGDDLEFLISHCPLIEELYVGYSYNTESLVIKYPLMRLRRLEFRWCTPLNTLEICSPNLLSFRITSYHSTGSVVPMNVSSIIDLSLTINFCNSLPNYLSKLTRRFSRLETLLINIPFTQICYPSFPDFPRLRKLELYVWSYEYETLLSFASLLDAAPMLREFKLSLGRFKSYEWEPKFRETKDATSGQRHECLEVLKIVRFEGMKTDVDLIDYVMEHAVSLKQVILDPHLSKRIGEAISELARESICLLQERLPEGVELIVL